MIDRDPLHLHPAARAKQEELHALAWRRLGLRLSLLETWRPADRQDEAFELGLTEKKAGGSHHNITLPNGDPAACGWHSGIDPEGPLLIGFGASLIHPRGTATIPVDLGRHGVKPLGPEELMYCALGLIGEEIGLTCGFRWDVRQRGPDWTHFQIKAPLSHIVAALAAGQRIA